MPRDDWLVGGDRRTAAAERIYAAATDLIAQDDALDVDILRRSTAMPAVKPRYVTPSWRALLPGLSKPCDWPSTV